MRASEHPRERVTVTLLVIIVALSLPAGAGAVDRKLIDGTYWIRDGLANSGRRPLAEDCVQQPAACSLIASTGLRFGRRSVLE